MYPVSRQILADILSIIQTYIRRHIHYTDINPLYRHILADIYCIHYTDIYSQTHIHYKKHILADMYPVSRQILADLYPLHKHILVDTLYRHI